MASSRTGFTAVDGWRKPGAHRVDRQACRRRTGLTARRVGAVVDASEEASTFSRLSVAPDIRYDGPMARFSTYNRVKFRLLKAEATWRELLELVRGAAAQPNYVGPDVAAFERIADDIGALRVELRSWAFHEASRQRPRPALRGAALRAVREVVLRR
jgi:hypothetical protein